MHTRWGNSVRVPAVPNLLDPRSGDQIDAPVGNDWRATLRRSVRLFSDFRVEQTDPARFYTALAADSVGQLAHYTDGETLQGTVLLDVGGGRSMRSCPP